MSRGAQFSVAFVVGAICVGSSLQAVAAEVKVYESREEIPAEYRWKLADVFASVDTFEAAVESVEEALPRIRAFKGRLGESAETLAEALALRFDTERAIEGVYVYATQWWHEDMREPAAKDLHQRARKLLSDLGEATSYFDPEITQIPDDDMAQWRKGDALTTYDHRLDDLLRTKAHIRSAEVEEVLASASMLRGTPSQVYTNLHDADLVWPAIRGAEGEELIATPSLFYQLLAESDRRVRKDAALAIFETYGKFGNTLASALAGSIQKDVWLARTRNYASTLDMSLDRDNVPPEIVDRLVSSVHDNIDVVHRYIALRKRALGLDAVHIYDLYANLTAAGEKTYTFDEGWELAVEFWRATFGDAYADVAERGLAERWVDVYPNTGKRGGAYSWGTYDAHPYLLLNWGGTLQDVFTLVHEMGHSIHTWLANQKQPYHLADYSLFVAELASVASESLFYEWLLQRTTDPKERLALLSLRLNTIVGTFLRQIFFHEFEAKAHAMAERGEPLTVDSLGKVWGDLWTTYYGIDASLDEVFRNGWARVSHFYRAFYVWKYATSFAAGEAIAARFRAGDATAVSDYIAALELGGSVYPMDALERAGVDLGDPKVIEAVMQRFGETITEMDKLLAAE